MAAKIDHTRWYAGCPDVALVAAADTNLDAANFYARHWGGRPYADAEEMVKTERPDVVSVCSPVAKHCEHTIMAADYGAHVFTEKPMPSAIQTARRSSPISPSVQKHRLTAWKTT